MIEISCAKFLNDFIRERHITSVISMESLNKCCDRLWEELWINPDFSKEAISTLINRNPGHIIWEYGFITVDEAFKKKIAEQTNDEEIPNDVKEQYLSILRNAKVEMKTEKWS